MFRCSSAVTAHLPSIPYYLTDQLISVIAYALRPGSCDLLFGDIGNRVIVTLNTVWTLVSASRLMLYSTNYWLGLAHARSLHLGLSSTVGTSLNPTLPT